MYLDPKELGRRGEERAAWFYRLRGYSVIARNLRLRSGELDLVVRRRSLLAFVEVKARQSLGAGEGFDSVDRRKRSRLVALGGEYLARFPHDGEIRYDIVSLYWTGSSFRLTHFPDAFRPVADARWPWRWRV